MRKIGDDQSDLLSAEEAAALLGLSESATYRLLQQGDVPAGKIGGQWRVRRSDLDLAFDLARARALAQIRERGAEETWGPALARLGELDAERKAWFEIADTHEYALTRCVWCPEFAPAWTTHLYTTLCSEECVAEIRRAYAVLAWPMDLELMISPIYTWYERDNYMSLQDYRDIEHRGLFLEMRPPDEYLFEGVGPERWLIATRWRLRHERGPLRELLVLEHPVMRSQWLGDGQARAPIRVGRKKPGDEELDGLGDLEDRVSRTKDDGGRPETTSDATAEPDAGAER